MAMKMPKWLDRISRLFLDPYYGIEVAAPPGKTTERSNEGLTRSLYGAFESDLTLGVSDKEGQIYIPARSEQVQLSRLMHQVDPRIGEILDRSVADAISGNWQWAVPGNVTDQRRTELLDRMNEVTNRLYIRKQLKDWTLTSFVDGDVFLQIVLSAVNQVSKIKSLPALSIQRVTNAADEFDDPKDAFRQYNVGVLIEDHDLSFEDEYKISAIHTFQAFEILHARIRHVSRHRYGRPLIFRAIQSARWLNSAETDIGQRRRQRATMRRKVSVGTPDHQPSEEEVYEWQSKFREMRAKGNEGREEDVFIPYWIDVENLDGDATISIVEDIKYHVDAVYAGTGMPKMLHGFLDDVNRDITEPVLDQYARVTQERSAWIGNEILVPLMRRILLIEGFPVVEDEIAVQWSTRTAYSVDDIDTAANTVKTMAELGFWDLEQGLEYMQTYIPDMDKDMIIQRIMEATADQDQEMM